MASLQERNAVLQELEKNGNPNLAATLRTAFQNIEREQKKSIRSEINQIIEKIRDDKFDSAVALAVDAVHAYYADTKVQETRFKEHKYLRPDPQLEIELWLTYFDANQGLENIEGMKVALDALHRPQLEQEMTHELRAEVNNAMHVYHSSARNSAADSTEPAPAA